MTIMYHDGNRSLQDRFDSRRIADRLEEKLTRSRFTDDDKAFIESLPFFFVATADAEGRPDCSFKGGPAGFVRVTGPSEFEVKADALRAWSGIMKEQKMLTREVQADRLIVN